MILLTHWGLEHPEGLRVRPESLRCLVDLENLRNLVHLLTHWGLEHPEILMDLGSLLRLPRCRQDPKDLLDPAHLLDRQFHH